MRKIYIIYKPYNNINNNNNNNNTFNLEAPFKTPKVTNMAELDVFPVSLSAKVKEEVLFKCVLFKCRHMCEFILFSTVLCCKCRGQGSFWGVSTVHRAVKTGPKRDREVR